MWRAAVLFSWLALVAAGCTMPAGAVAPTGASAGPSSSSGAAAASGTAPDMPAAPVDSSLAPVSMSNPPADAKTALDACVRPGDTVAGMARLASARDAHKYMLSNGREPELQADVPVWMVQLSGVWTFRGRTAFNPVCIVINGEATFYAPYGTVSDGPNWSPPSDFVAPALALPPLAP